MKGLECELWRAVIVGPFQIGQLNLGVVQVTQLKQVSGACDGWIVFDDAAEESFIRQRHLR